MRTAARLAAGAAGLLLAASPVLVHRAPARADAGSGLGGFRAGSEASGLDLIYNDGSEVSATLPLAQTSFSTGSGHALAADFYPGPVGGNPGATVAQLLGANLPPQLVGPLSTLQDNAKAEAYSSGPNDSTFPSGQPPQAVYDTAHADDNGATATGSIVNAGEQMVSTSRTTVSSDSVTTTATSTVSDISIAGVIHIAQVTSTAYATSGVTSGGATTVAKVTGQTVISGVTVAGQSVSVSPSGITVGPTTIPLDASSIVDTALKSAGISMQISPEDRKVAGGQGSEHAPALSIFVNLPDNGGNTFTITLGGAAAEANTSPAFVLPPLPGAAAAPVAGVPSAPSEVAPAVAGPIDSGPQGDNQSAFAPPTTTPGPRRQTVSPAAADFTGLKAGLLLLGLAIAGVAAFGMGKIPDDVLADKASAVACPLERDSP